MYPGDPNGPAAEVINCRCTSDTRARWALDEEELQTLKDRAAFFGLDKTENFEEFKREYIQIEKEESKNKYNNTVTSQFIKTPDYRNLYNNLDEPTEIQRTACKKAREMLSHRSGTKYEDLTYINAETGKHLTRTDYNVEGQVIPNKPMREMLNSAKPYTIISIHNHPGSAMPSMTDIDSAYAKKYKYGIIACHNGYVFKYQVTGEYDLLYADMLLDKAQIALYNSDGVDKEALRQALKDLKSHNIVLEVFAHDL